MFRFLYIWKFGFPSISRAKVKITYLIIVFHADIHLLDKYNLYVCYFLCCWLVLKQMFSYANLFLSWTNLSSSSFFFSIWFMLNYQSSNCCFHLICIWFFYMYSLCLCIFTKINSEDSFFFLILSKPCIRYSFYTA